MSDNRRRIVFYDFYSSKKCSLRSDLKGTLKAVKHKVLSGKEHYQIIKVLRRLRKPWEAIKTKV